MTPLQQRVRDSGIVSPSLLHETLPEPEDGFENSAVQLLDGNHGGCVLTPGSLQRVGIVRVPYGTYCTVAVHTVSCVRLLPLVLYHHND